MQSRQIKKVQEYEIGENVYEGNHYLGKVASAEMHPSDETVGYLLLTNKMNEFTIFKGMANARCGLRLARNLPESVAMQFAEVVLGKKPIPKKPRKKYPVVTKVEEAEPEPLAPTVGVETKTTGAPYFNFV